MTRAEKPAETSRALDELADMLGDAVWREFIRGIESASDPVTAKPPKAQTVEASEVAGR
jgi:hypothetical protein